LFKKTKAGEMSEVTMRAFHNDKKVQKKYLARVKAHAKADEFVKGQYWQNGKGCAVGCTIHDSDHKKYETELGIPEWLARVEDSFFENLPNDKAKEWPVKFLEAISVGADLNKIKPQFMIYILEQSREQVAEKPEYDYVDLAICQVIELWKTDPLQLNTDDWSAAESAAWSAWSARSAAGSAAESAAWSARSAARSAAWSAAWSARSAAESEAYVKYSEALLEMMRECKP
jgi:hypothetical protein